jgi:hypothetical protein
MSSPKEGSDETRNANTTQKAVREKPKKDKLIRIRK